MRFPWRFSSGREWGQHNRGIRGRAARIETEARSPNTEVGNPMLAIFGGKEKARNLESGVWSPT